MDRGTVTEVAWSDPKPALVTCPCGCGKVGRPRTKAWADGLAPHVKACTCRRCSGRRHKPRAARTERRIAKDTGGERSPLSGALTGHDGHAGLDCWEHTADLTITRGFFKWWRGKGVQSKIERISTLNGMRPHLILEDKETGELVVITRYEPWTDVIRDANR